MQILGLYGPINWINTLKVLKQLHNAQSFLPIVFSLEPNPFQSPNLTISIFPAFYSVDRRATMCKVLTQSFCSKDQGYDIPDLADHINKISIYLVDSSDMPSVSALAKDMTVIFPRINSVKLYFKRRSEVVPVSFLLTIIKYNRT